MAGIGLASPLLHTQHQLLLGDNEFVARFRYPAVASEQRAITRPQRRALALPLPDYAGQSADRDEAMANAYHSNAYTMQQIGEHFGVSDKTVSRAVKKYPAR